jgi:hypothetical protein
MFEAITIATFMSLTAFAAFMVTIATLWSCCNSWHWK